METKTRKNLKFILVLLGCIFLSIFAFSGCIFNLNTPVIYRYGAEIQWSAIDNATSYEVVFSSGDENQQIVSTKENVINVSPYVTAGNWDVKVRAITTDIFRNNSNFSNIINFTVGEGLDTPTNLEIKKQENDVVASWETVIGATYYQLKLKIGDDELAPIQTTDSKGSFVLTNTLNVGATYTATVQSIKDVDGAFLVSAESDPCSYTNKITLASPTISSFSKVGTNYIISWNEVAQATSYNVSLLGVNSAYATTNTSLTLSEAQLGNLAKVGDNFNKQALQVAFVQATSTNENCFDSDFSLGRAYVGLDTTKAKYQSIKVDYFYHNLKAESPEAFDLCANSQAELNALIAFVLYYRLDAKDFTFYWDYETDIKTSINNAFDAYDEISEIDRNKGRYSISSSDKKIKIVDIGYKSPSTPTLVAYKNASNVDENITQQQFLTINSFTKTPRTDPATLPINNRTKTMNVYTGEQLFMAVQAGYKPVFVGGNSGGKIIWEKAQQVALQIIDNSMTDYQKVLAIFDWICYTNTYDHNLYSLYKAGKTDNLMSYTGWYMEGMFLNDGQAVCDGISKAFSLLCGIENIDAYKVNGYANGDPKAGHAWNKVKLNGNWYGLDCTWADASNLNGTKDVLAHRYFLVTDAVLSYGNKHIETFPCLNTANTDFDYFAETTVTIGDNVYDMIIDSGVEKVALLAYLYSHFDNFELKSSEPIYTTETDWQKIDYTPAMPDTSYHYYVFYKNI